MGMKYGRPVDNLAVRVASSTLPIIANGNGSYSGAPAIEEDPQYPMTNLYYPDRYRVWSTRVGNSPGGNIEVHIDLAGGSSAPGAGGADVTVSSLGLLGLRPHASGAIATVGFGYRTRAQGYSASGYAGFVSSPIAANPPRDSIGIDATPVSARYILFSINGTDTSGFSLGSFWVGVLQDVGIFWSADGGATWGEDHNVLLSPTAGGHQTAVNRGDPFARYTLSFFKITNATRAILETHFGAAQRGQPILILDENNVPRQFLVMDGPQFSQAFDGLYSATLNLVRLG